MKHTTIVLSHVVVVVVVVTTIILVGSCCSSSSKVNAFAFQQQPPPWLSTRRTQNKANHHHRYPAFLWSSSKTSASASSSSSDDDDADNHNHHEETRRRMSTTKKAPPQEENEQKEDETTAPVVVVQSSSVVEECYQAWNKGDMTKAVSYFADNFNYEDSQFWGSIQTKQELQKSFQQRKDLLNAALLVGNNNNSPPPPQVVVDHVAVCTNTGNIATEYHVEYYNNNNNRDITEDNPHRVVGTGVSVPLTRGCAFYTTTTTTKTTTSDEIPSNPNNFQITSGFRVLEMMVKPPPEIANQLVSGASTFSNLGGALTSRSSRSTSTTTTTTMSSPNSGRNSSIIEQYFEAWNQRDFDTALSYFEDDCLYETEDPVFVGTLRGKDELRLHLEQNAKALPSSCQIILDGLAVDNWNDNGNIGTTWHLEVHGIPLPNLRGCSMYTTNALTGRLQTGFDVTEAPVKIPKGTLLPLVPAKLVGRLVSPLLMRALAQQQQNPKQP